MLLLAGCSGSARNRVPKSPVVHFLSLLILRMCAALLGTLRRSPAASDWVWTTDVVPVSRSRTKIAPVLIRFLVFRLAFAGPNRPSEAYSLAGRAVRALVIDRLDPGREFGVEFLQAVGGIACQAEGGFKALLDRKSVV